MGKKSHDDVLDAALAEIATSTREGVCSDEPADFSGIAALLLAEVVMTAGLGAGDYTAADGDTNGRKVTMAQQADVPIDVSGTATHVTLDDGATLLYVTTCTSQALTDTGTVTIPAWDVEFADPT